MQVQASAAASMCSLPSAHLILAVDVRAAVQQQLHDVYAATIRCLRQRRLAVLRAAAARVSARGRGALPACAHVVSGIHGQAAIQQHRAHVQMAKERRAEERCLSALRSAE